MSCVCVCAHARVCAYVCVCVYSLQPKMEKLYTVGKKQDQELTVAQNMNSLLPNSELNWRKWGKPQDHSGMT